MKRFRGGLVFKAHRLLYHSTLGSKVMKKKRKCLRIQAEIEHLRRLSPESKGQNLALTVLDVPLTVLYVTVLYVPCSLDSGSGSMNSIQPLMSLFFIFITLKPGVE